jgi:hypothetical protein
MYRTVIDISWSYSTRSDVSFHFVSGGETKGDTVSCNLELEPWKKTLVRAPNVLLGLLVKDQAI